MKFQFVDENAVKRGILQNNMTSCEQNYVSLEVSLEMQQAMAADTTLDDSTRNSYANMVASTEAQMADLDAQWNAWNAQLSALPATVTESK